MSQNGAISDILLMPQEEIQQLLDKPDDADGLRKRVNERMAYRVKDGIHMDVTDARGRRRRVPVAPRDISRCGIGMLHCGALSGGTNVVVHLPSSAGDTMSVPGYVVRCFGLKGNVYDVGVSFEQEIEPAPILAHARYLQSKRH
ncbi:MAG TPA: PilZ domain-containing protein [Phycisphaerae bacterium]|nr:PilZ domain-containing protein [Phycisphaerae bacterium]